MQISIIGTYHAYQLSGHGNCSWEQFRGFVRSFVERGDFDLLAEEMSAEAIAMCADVGVSGSVLNELASEHTIMHLFADPNAQERDALGIGGSSDLPKETQEKIREQEWLRRITQTPNTTRVLFVIGANHVSSVVRQLRQEGHAVEEVVCGWYNPSDKIFLLKEADCRMPPVLRANP